MNRLFAFVFALLAATAFAIEPTTQLNAQPATVPAAYAPGLVARVYKLARAPKGIAKIPLGQSPDAVWMLPSLKTKPTEVYSLRENFQADISGEFFAEVDGKYAFRAVSDDGVDLTIDDALVLSDRWVNGVDRRSEASVVLKAGWHRIHVAFFQSDRTAGFEIHARSPGSAEFVEVPPAWLRVEQAALDAARSAIGGADPSLIDKPWRSALRSNGFGGLTDAEAEIFAELLEGPTAVSAAARGEWQKLAKSTGYERLAPSQQTMVLSGFLHGWLYYGTTRPQPTTRVAYTMSEPERLLHFEGWAGIDRHGVKYVLAIDGRTIDIFMPTAGVDECNSVPKAIAGLPHYLRQYIKSVHVEPYGTAAELNGGNGQIWIRMPGPALLKELDSVFVHEAGHLLMQGTNCLDLWTDALARDLLSVSQYGRRNSHEDFAEFLRLYVTAGADAEQLQSLRTLYPARMKAMDAIVRQASATTRPAD